VIWRSSLSELDCASKLIDQECELLTQQLSTYTYDFEADGEKLLDGNVFASRIEEIRR